MTKNQLAIFIAGRLKTPDLGRSDTFKKAWGVVNEIVEASEPLDSHLNEAGICPSCLISGWLIESPNGNVMECKNCGQAWLLID